MNVLFVICARAGSKGVKNKNISNFIGYPLVTYTLAIYNLFLKTYGLNYNKINLALNTDSDILVDQVKKTGVEYVYVKRQPLLAGDTVSKLEVIKDTLKQTEKIKDCKYDIIVDLDLTSPIRRIEDIDKILDELMNVGNADVIFSMANSRRSPYFNLVEKKENGYYNTVISSKYVSRQEAPQCFDMNASIYAYKRTFVLSDNTVKVFDGNAIGVEVMDTAVLDIDNKEDMELMELLAKHFYDKYDEYGKIYKEMKIINNV